MIDDGMALIARSHDPNIHQNRTEKSRKLQFWRICEPPLLNSLFSKSHFAARGDNHSNTVAREYGKRELMGKGGAAFLLKGQISNLVGKIKSCHPGQTLCQFRYAMFCLKMSRI